MNKPVRVVIEGVDGSGKSTAAQEAALGISQANPLGKISLVDSTGVYRYHGGEQVDHNWTHLESLEPNQNTPKAVAVFMLGAFTAARRVAESRAMRGAADLVIGVRDPYRADPATYAPVFGLPIISKLQPAQRLEWFNRLTRSQHPDLFVNLVVEPGETARPTGNPNGQLDRHETPEKLERISRELPLVLNAYHELYGTRLIDIQALDETTSQEVASQIEPFLPRQSRPVYFAPSVTSL